MENNLDKYFKENLEGRQFEMKDAYWQNAQKLLLEDERRRRRKLWLWWGGGASILMAFLVVLFFMKNEGGTNLTEIKTINAEEANPVEKNNDLVNNNLISNGETIEKTGKNKVVKNKIGDDKAVQKSTGEYLEINRSEATSGKNAPLKIKSGNIEEREVPESNSSVFFDSEKQKGLNSKKENLIKEIYDEKEEGGAGQNPRVEMKDASEATDEISINEAIVVAPDLLSPLAVLVEKEVDVDFQVTEKESLRKRKWSFGVSAAQLVQAPVDSGEMTAIAFRAGFFTKYKWSEKNNFYLLAGLNYQRRTGTFGQSKSAESRNYRFGLELAKNELRPSSLHTLSLPILLGHEKGRHILETGFSMDYLTGVRGERGSVERIPGSDPPRRDFAPVESGWISDFGFKKWTSTAQFNYRFRVNTQWSFGLSANYTFGGILDEVSGNLIEGGKVNLPEDDNFYFGLQAAYLIR